MLYLLEFTSFIPELNNSNIFHCYSTHNYVSLPEAWREGENREPFKTFFYSRGVLDHDPMYPAKHLPFLSNIEYLSIAILVVVVGLENSI